jgi:hypothetical protein
MRKETRGTGTELAKLLLLLLKEIQGAEKG